MELHSLTNTPGARERRKRVGRGLERLYRRVESFSEGVVDAAVEPCQKAVEVLPGDTPEGLQRRIMEQAEWKIMPQAINMIAEGEIQLG